MIFPNESQKRTLGSNKFITKTNLWSVFLFVFYKFNSDINYMLIWRSTSFLGISPIRTHLGCLLRDKIKTTKTCSSLWNKHREFAFKSGTRQKTPTGIKFLLKNLEKLGNLNTFFHFIFFRKRTKLVVLFRVIKRRTLPTKDLSKILSKLAFWVEFL